MKYQLSYVKEWFKKDLFTNSQAETIYNYAFDDMEELYKETEKAVCIKFHTELGVITKWFPKSVFMTEEEKQAQLNKCAEIEAKIEAKFNAYEKLIQWAKEQQLPVRKMMKKETVLNIIKKAGLIAPQF